MATKVGWKRSNTKKETNLNEQHYDEKVCLLGIFNICNLNVTVQETRVTPRNACNLEALGATSMYIKSRSS